MKLWQVAEPIGQDTVASFPQVERHLLQLLWNRGLTNQAAIDEYLNPNWESGVPDPYLFLDMTKAVERIYQAIKQGEIIAVYGDYDADGVSAATILLDSLRKLGANTQVYIPHRENEGYGLHEEALHYLKNKGVSLIITCDCGIANVSQVKTANELGLTVIITDHHTPQEQLPPAYAILHGGLPRERYPFKKLSGGGVAFKLVQGLLRHELCPLNDKTKESWEKWLLDLVAISTVADMVPLQGENRTLVYYGLTVLKKTKRLGLRELINQAVINIDKLNAQTISFQIAPRLNAAGRLDHANTALALLLSSQATEAVELAKSISLTNTQRQKLTDEMFAQAKEQIGELTDGQFFVHAYYPTWQLGMVGLVAGKLAQYYNRPALVLCDNNGRVAGSARSGVGQFDLAQAFSRLKDFLISFGGHKEAAGLALSKDKLEPFLRELNQLAQKQLIGQDLRPSLAVDMVVNLSEISWELYDTVTKLEPVGQNNPRALFAIYNLTVKEFNLVGGAGQHIRLLLSDGQTENKFIMFNAAEINANIKLGQAVDLVFELGVNEWNNQRDLQLKIIDWKNHDAD